MNEQSGNTNVKDNDLNKSWKKIWILLFILFFLVASLVLLNKFRPRTEKSSSPTAIDKKSEFEMKKFASESELKQYLLKSQEDQVYYGQNGMIGVVPQEKTDLNSDLNMGISKLEDTTSVDRVSNTNVQVQGIDEPDIVKTDGKNLFLSTLDQYYSIMDQPTTGISKDVATVVPEQSPDTTKIINIFPPKDISKKSEITETGTLLLDNTNLMVFSSNKITSYNTSDPDKPSKKWQMDIDTSQEIISSRLFDGKVYLATRTYVNENITCPIPLRTGGVSVECTDIYHPIIQVPADSLITLMVIDPENGNVIKKNSFIGTSGLSFFYMSKEDIYVTYTFYQNMIEFFYDFLKNEGDGIVKADVLERIKKLNQTQISLQAKMTEFSVIMQNYLSSLSQDEALKFQNDLQDKFQKYTELNARKLEQTGIVKVNLKDLTITADGIVPGRPLNQFSLDDYEGNLRVATTIGQGNIGTTSSLNDVYVLNSNLDIIGQVLGLGKNEKIYSVRFLNDMGYVVTFRETDPFYVISLKDPKNPVLEGELKIPGYSSYLHPIGKSLVLGVGKEDSNVKLSLFDVSDPKNPRELSKYRMDEYWSDVLNTHHAFLMDEKHNIFFIPGSKGGYIFSYKDNTIDLIQAVSATTPAQRAIYVNNYLYTIFKKSISVFDETSWEKVSGLDI